VATHREAAEEPEPPIAGVSVRERSRANYEVRRFPPRQTALPLPAVDEPKPEELAPAVSKPVAIKPLVTESAEPEPALISNASQLQEVAPGVAVLGCVPEITAHPSDIETPHTNGAGHEPVAPKAPAVVESHAAGAADSVPSLQPPAADEPVKSDESYEWVNRIGLELLAPREKPRRSWRVPLSVGLVAGLMLIVGLFYSGLFQRYFNSTNARPQSSTLASTAPASDTPVAPPAADNNLQTLEQRAASKPADPSSLVELAREYQRRKDWTKAETAYRSALETSPGNRDAALGLSDVLYQQQKYEESAAVLNKISSDKTR
jgi:hypothetical protein